MNPKAQISTGQHKKLPIDIQRLRFYFLRRLSLRGEHQPSENAARERFMAKYKCFFGPGIISALPRAGPKGRFRLRKTVGAEQGSAVGSRSTESVNSMA